MYPYHRTADAEGNETLYVFLPDRDPVIVQDDHPKYQEIIEAAQDEFSSTGDIEDLADASNAIATQFRAITERVSVANGRVYFDGDQVHSSISAHIIRAIESCKDIDWDDEAWPYAEIAFLEKVQDNPNEHSREQLYDWLQAEDFSITSYGDIVGYKGVARDADNTLLSVRAGMAIVNGETITGQIPNAIGSVVEMPRSAVAHDPSESCSTGLHVGTFDYAHNWASGAMLKVAVNPRDVVSVPTDAGGKKIRVCRYRVVDVIDAPETLPVVEDDYEEECGDRWGDCYCDDCVADREE